MSPLLDVVVDVVVVGAGGRLGSLVCTEAARDPQLRLAGRVGRADSLLEVLWPLTQSASPSSSTCVIDLATAGATRAHAELCARANAPYVVATTGLTAEDERALDEAAKVVPVLSAANLSVSAHVAARLVREAAVRLRSFDVEVVEVHHKKKKDAPSGTALMLANAAKDARGAGAIKRARDGVSPREADDIGVAAVRGGDVVGEHTVHFFGEGERIDLVHRVTDRAVFARGALVVAKFLAGKPAGRYQMADVVGA